MNGILCDEDGRGMKTLANPFPGSFIPGAGIKETLHQIVP
jgi:hypothetical protein